MLTWPSAAPPLCVRRERASTWEQPSHADAPTKMSFEESRQKVAAVLKTLMSSDAPEPVAPIREALGAEAEAALGDTEKATLELVMRMHMDELLTASKEPGQSIEAAGVPKLEAMGGGGGGGGGAAPAAAAGGAAAGGHPREPGGLA